MERKLDVGATLSETFSIYRSQAGVLLPVAFCVFIVVAIVNGVLAGNLTLFPIAMAVSVVAGTLYQGLVVSLVSDVQDGRRDSSVGDLIRSTAPVIGPLILAGLLAGIGIGIGFVLIVVPGLILMTIWAVIAPVIVIERPGVLPAFGRSRELVRDNGWQVFGVIVTVFLITIVVQIALGAISLGIEDSTGVRIVFNAIAATVTAPITALVAAVVYFRLRAIKGAPGPAAADPYAAPPLAEPAAPPSAGEPGTPE
jgi:hypothetical protein